MITRGLTLMLLLVMAVPARAGDSRELLADRARITPAQAERAALGTGSGTVHEIELKVRKGRPVFQVKFTDGRKVLVDAVSGAVLGRDRPAGRNE